MKKALVIIGVLYLMFFSVFLVVNYSKPSITGNVVASQEANSEELKALREEIQELKEEVISQKSTGPEGEFNVSVKVEDNKVKVIHTPQEIVREKVIREYDTFRVIEGTKDPDTAILLFTLKPSQIEEEENTIIQLKEFPLEDADELYNYLRNSDLEMMIIQEVWGINEATEIRRATGVSVMVKFATKGERGEIEPLTFKEP